LAKLLGIAEREFVWFEHGPSDIGTVVGCGVDYAHLHVILHPPFLYEALADEAVRSSGLEWRNVQSSEIYCELPSNRSYLAIGRGTDASFATDVESTGSQFLRRSVAKLVGREDDWNYRETPEHSNIERTVALVRSLLRNATNNS
jgi:hypothetical protein